ncbi:hypothetical protein CNR22_23805 [Sphingobacteriaceae bacterium]|nr:hypothetical protein CNR22_23805 [Sphingobacteriaceae bacterium]
MTNGVHSGNGLVIYSYTINPIPNISVNSGSYCAGDAFTITPTGAVSYTITGGSFVVSPSTVTSYSISGTSALGCASTVQAVSTVSVFAKPNITVSSGTLCSASVFTLNPVGGVTYTFSGGSAAVSPTTTTSYSVYGTNVAGCSNATAAIATVSVFTTPTITVNSGTVCAGKVYTFTPSGSSTSYSYSNGSSTIAPTSNTTVIVSSTSTAGCVSQPVTATVNIIALPTITASNGSFCSGGSYTITPSGGVSYSVTGGVFVVNPTVNTSYSVTGTNSLGCSNATPVVITVSVNPIPTLSVNSGTNCSANAFTIIPQGATNYTITGGTNIVSPGTTTSYSVTGTSAFGCAASNTAVSTVTVFTSPVVSSPSGSICNGQGYTITATGVSSYSVIGGPNVVFPTSTANFSVIGSSSVGCQSTNTAIVTVTVNAVPSVSVNSGGVCTGGVFTLNPSGASTYVFSNGSSTIAPSTNTTVSVIGTSSEGCTSTAVISTIAVSNMPTVSVNSGTVCSGGVFTFSPTGAPSYSFQSGTNTVSPTSSGSYTVVGINLGCVSLPAVSNLTVIAAPVLSITVVSPSNAIVCEDAPIIFSATGGITYTWNATTATGTSYTANLSTSGAFSVSGSDLNGCVGTATTLVIVNPAPQLTLTASSLSVCAGSSSTLIVTGGQTYTWSAPGTGSSIVVSPVTSTTYSVSSDNALGCVKTKTLTISVNTIVLAASPNTAVCEGGSVILSADGAVSYSWFPVASSVSSVLIVPSTSSTYTYNAIDAINCYHSGTISVTVNQNPVVSITGYSVICFGETASVTANGANTYLWNDSLNTATPVLTVSPVTNTTYAVVGTDAKGCVSNASIELTVNACAGIAESRSQLVGLTAYPNPTSGEFTIDLPNGLNKSVQITDLAGRVVYSTFTSENKMTFNLKNLDNGIYYVKVQSGKGEEVLKVIKH